MSDKTKAGRLYLYLLNRNKEDLKVVMALQGLVTMPTKITDISVLRLEAKVVEELRSIVEEHKAQWDLWIEPANNYQELYDNLRRRGYYKIPLKSKPIHSESSFNDPHVADTRQLAKKSTMVRKAT
jgi:hypothetical protein